jgi:hypothetical protein
MHRQAQRLLTPKWKEANLTHRVGSGENSSARPVLRFDEAQTWHYEEMSVQSGIDGQLLWQDEWRAPARASPANYNAERKDEAPPAEVELHALAFMSSIIRWRSGLTTSLLIGNSCLG